MEENKVENVINIFKEKLRLRICLNTSNWENILYNKIEKYKNLNFPKRN